MLEFDDIQHLLLTRAPALTARYEFLSFRDGAGGRAWVSAIKETIHSAASMRAGVDQNKRWVTAAFTWNGLSALGLDEASLASFPEEFKQGMAARAEVLGDTGANAPEHWVGELASPDLHAIVILFARDKAEQAGASRSTESLSPAAPASRSSRCSTFRRIPPFGYAHEHFGYRDRLSEPAIEGNGVEPTPGTGEPLKPGEFILGYPDEYGVIADSPRPEILARNGSYMAYRRLEEHVGKFREFLRQHGDSRGGAGTDRGQADGALAQRRAARARARKRRFRRSAPTCSATTTSPTRRRIRMAMRSRSARTFAG